jgi:hypothetical protein
VQTIELFMWGYQTHLAAGVASLAKRSLEALGETVDTRVFLVGVAAPGRSPRHPVCVEPEHGRRPLSDFADLPTALEEAYQQDEGQHRFFTDARTQAEWPGRLRRKILGDLVLARARGRDAEFAVVSFCGPACRVDDYDVVCVLELPSDLIERYPPVAFTWNGERQEMSLLTACVSQLLVDASLRLQEAEPGRGLSDYSSPDEIARRAAGRFMSNPFLGQDLIGADLFKAFDGLSLTRYETDATAGRLVLAGPGLAVDLRLTLSRPVPVGDARWARKIQQMADRDIFAIMSKDGLIGLGSVSPEALADAYVVDFHGHHQWEFRQGDQALLRVRHGTPSLPYAAIPPGRIVENLRRIVPETTLQDAEQIGAAISALSELRGGTLLVIAADAAVEAARLDSQAMLIEPAQLDNAVLARAAAVDGAILMTPDGKCHAIGAILDGPAHLDCIPSRGSRYNSAVRYVRAAPRRMAVILSEDRSLDIVPMLRPRVRQSDIDAALDALDCADNDTFHRPRNFLDSHRFYLDEVRCHRANQAIARIDALPRAPNELYFATALFEPDPELSADYFAEE